MAGVLSAAAVAAPAVLDARTPSGTTTAALTAADLEDRLWRTDSRGTGRTAATETTPSATASPSASSTPTPDAPQPTDGTDAGSAADGDASDGGTSGSSDGSRSSDGTGSTGSSGSTGGDAATPAPAPPAAPSPAAAAPSSVDAQIVTLGNTARRSLGLPDLAVDECARQQAGARAALLVAEGRFEHDPLEPVLAACGGRTVGENLALGYPTAQATVDAWLASPGHRANLLSASFTGIGVACVDSPRGRLCAQVFVG